MQTHRTETLSQCSHASRVDRLRLHHWIGGWQVLSSTKSRSLRSWSMTVCSVYWMGVVAHRRVGVLALAVVINAEVCHCNDLEHCQKLEKNLDSMEVMCGQETGEIGESEVPKLGN